MFCTQCGIENQTDAKFCRKCGHGMHLDESILDDPVFSKDPIYMVLRIGSEVLVGKIDAARKNFDSAITYLEHAVHLEDTLLYTKPLAWHHPPRLALAAVLLESGRDIEAEAVYWEDLRRHRNSGWSLYGLLKALRAQKKEHEAGIIEERFEKAWKRADVNLADIKL